MLDTEPPALLASCIPLFFLVTSGSLFSITLLLVLILCSALISGSEVAYFSLGPIEIKDMQDDEEGKVSKRVLSLLDKPRRLLATILIANNFINIAIVIVSDYLVRSWLGQDILNTIGMTLNEWMPFIGVDGWARAFNFSVTVIGVTFILVLFGEVAPKIYANIDNVKVARLMSRPLSFLNTVFGPLSSILVKWTMNIEERFSGNTNNSNHSIKEDLDKAIELTVSDSVNSEEEAEILKGIVKFGDVRVKQIMKSRVDVIAAEQGMNFRDLLEMIKEHGYSRIPVYEDDFDQVRGILYVKDLLGLSDEGKDYDWSPLVRDTVLYVPESKKIDELLREFQAKRMHLAIVVDEYGGSAGIITLEDIMEEVIGDIKDEFDEDDDVEYVKLDENNYIFEGKSLLNDVVKITSLSDDFFDEYKNEADSIAGLIIEVVGQIPKPDREIKIANATLKVISTTNKRIERVNLKLENDE